MGKQVQAMADHRQILSTCVLFMLIAQVHSQQREDGAWFTYIKDYQQKLIVCLDGTPAGYHHKEGYGSGVNNWLVLLQGGGWCQEGNCHTKRKHYTGSSEGASAGWRFGGIQSGIQEANPEFYNWNRVNVHYCDGGSFLGDTEANDTGVHVQLRGSRIFDAIMDDLLAKGMKDANNALLAGMSAGGLATILHCDGFRALIPNANRVKCISDSGFFIRAKDLPYADFREGVFAQTIEFHKLTKFLPTSCTSRMNPYLCLFPEYLVGDVQTPLFLLHSAFDSYQIKVNMKPYPDKDSWIRCTNNTNLCTPAQRGKIKEFRNVFLDTLKGLPNNPSRGFLINSCYIHTMLNYPWAWSSKGYGLENKSISQAFSDWFFDRSSVQLIDTQNDFVVGCQG